MIAVSHQFKQEPFYEPDWKIKFLFLGTFNPAGGEKVNYYYGRGRNQTWKLLSKLFEIEFNPNKPELFFKTIQKYGIACMDIIDEVHADKSRLSCINGKGYKDSKIINTSVKRIYNTERICRVIESNPGVQVFTTWGAGAKLREWRSEVANIANTQTLVSPSMAARVPKGVVKFDYMLSDWQTKIKI
ncbi:hypothetical protein OB13_11735 [Pontibacter sp. HJ8]